MRARIRAPFDGKIILLKQNQTTTLEVKSTVCRQAARGLSYPCWLQHLEGVHPSPGAASQGRHANLRQDPHWKDDQSLAGRLLSPTSFPLGEPSHDKSPPRTTSLRPARQVQALTGSWARAHYSADATDAWGGANLHVMQKQQLATMQATRHGKSLNAGLTSRTAITSPSSPTLHPQDSTGGTQAPSTTRTSLDLGSGVAS
jgi:hypothetical protein